jgi:hypothetical protein
MGTGATPFFRDGQCQEPFVAQALLIFDWMACIAVMPSRADREVGRQLAALLLQVSLLLAEPEIHAGGLLAGDSNGSSDHRGPRRAGLHQRRLGEPHTWSTVP